MANGNNKKTLRVKLGLVDEKDERKPRANPSVEGVKLGLTGDRKSDDKTLKEAARTRLEEVEGPLGWAADLGALNRGAHTANETFDRRSDELKAIEEVRTERRRG